MTSISERSAAIRERMRKGRETLCTVSGATHTRGQQRLLALGYWLAIETLMERCDRGAALLEANPALRAKGNARGRAIALRLGRLELRQVRLIAKLAAADTRIEEEFLAAHPDILIGAAADRAIAALGVPTSALAPAYAQATLV